MCVGADGKIRTVPSRTRAAKCKRFSPRKICTTCGHGCSQDEKAGRPFGDCPEWELKVLSTWGGNRRWRRKAEDGPAEQTENQSKEDQK